MRFFIPTHATPPQIVNVLGSQFELTTITAKRRDAAQHEVQFFDSYESPVSIELPGTPEVRFVVKRVGDWQGDAVVVAEDYEWSAVALAYVARPSYDTHGLTSVFVGASGFEVVTADTTLDSTHLGQLVVVNHADARTITVAPSLGSGSEKVYVQRVGAGTVTIAAGSGVTITVSAGAALAVEERQVLVLTRTGANAWTLSEAEEEDEVTLMAEFSWRDARQPASWASTKKFDHVVENDVVRGDETAPTDPTAPTVYVTQAQLEAEVTSQLSAQIGAPAGGAVPDNTGATVRGEVTQVRVAGGLFGGFSLSRLKDTFSGSDLQHDVCTIEADTLSEGAVIEFLIEGSRFQVDGFGGYRNAITIDTTEVFTFTRNEITAFDDQRIAYRLRGQMIITKTGASGAMSVSWELTERAGSTTVTSDSLPTSATSTDASAVAIDTTTDFDLGLAAAYTVAEGQRDHCITRAFMRRIL